MIVAPVARAQKAACTVPPSTRSTTGHIYGTLVSLDDHPMPRDYTLLLLQSIGQSLQATPPAALAAYDVTDSTATPAAYASARFTVTDVGHVQDVKLIASSLSPTFDQNLLAALTAIDSGGLVPPFPEGMQGSKIFELQLETGVFASDTSVGVTAILASTPLPVWTSARAAHEKHGASSGPDYPNGPIYRTVFERIALRFVIGPEGRMARQTVEAQPGSLNASPGSDHRETLTADQIAKRFADDIRREPATIAGCPVPARIFERTTYEVQSVRPANKD
jgi:hypothetical protein